MLRAAATLMRARALAATDGGFGWRLANLPGANEVWADRDAAGFDAFMIATTATRLNPNPGTSGYDDAAHIASWHPGVALAVAMWLDAAAAWREQNPDEVDDDPDPDQINDPALVVAMAYLGNTVLPPGAGAE